MPRKSSCRAQTTNPVNFFEWLRDNADQTNGALARFRANDYELSVSWHEWEWSRNWSLTAVFLARDIGIQPVGPHRRL